MNIFHNSILPFSIILIASYGLYKKLPVFTIFCEGAKKALKQTADLLPALTALTVSVSMLISSGASEIITGIFSPLCRLTGFPEEVLPLCFISPVSGSAAISVLENIFRTCSPDSPAGQLASIIAGASETTFYAVAVYFGSAGITKTRYTIPAALTADIANYTAAFITVFSIFR